MEGGIVFEALLQNQRMTISSDGFDPPWIPNSFNGDKTNLKKQLKGQEEHSDEDDEKCLHRGAKKRRLTVDQVQFLERSFEEENKLEPDRKIQLAKDLNLQPRQVAIWFQNRRARCKTKQLEKDYEILNSSYDKLKSDFDCLQKHNDKLKNEVERLKEKLHQRENGDKDSIPNTRELDSNAEEANPSPISIKNWSNEPKMVICKQEYANSVSTKSDVIDSYSPDANHSLFGEPCDSSNDFTQEEEDNLTILRCPKIEYESYIEGCPIEDQPFWLWP